MAGQTYWPGQSTFNDLPAGEYSIMVVDKENCSQTGPTVTITEPDTLIIEVFSTSDITQEADGSIIVTAYRRDVSLCIYPAAGW